MPVSRAVEAVSNGLSGGCFERRDPSQHGKGSLRSDTALMGPGAEDLGCRDDSDAGLLEQARRGEPGDQLCQLRFKVCRLLREGKGAACGSAHGSSGGSAFAGLGSRDPQMSAPLGQLIRLQFAEPSSQRVGCTDDQMHQRVKCSRAVRHDLPAGYHEHPDGLAIATLSRLGQVVEVRGLACNAFRVELVGLASAVVPRARKVVNQG